MATKLSQDELLEQFENLTLIELAAFVKAFEEKFDVTAAAPVAGAAAAGVPGAPAEEVEEKDSSTSFSRPPATRRSRSSRRSAP